MPKRARRDALGRFTTDFGCMADFGCETNDNVLKIKVPCYSYIPFFCILLVLFFALSPWIFAAPSIYGFLMKNLAMSILNRLVIPQNITKGYGAGGT